MYICIRCAFVGAEAETRTPGNLVDTDGWPMDGLGCPVFRQTHAQSPKRLDLVGGLNPSEKY